MTDESKFPCPQCGHLNFRIIKTTYQSTENWVVRLRECTKCMTQVKTTEITLEKARWIPIAEKIIAKAREMVEKKREGEAE